MSSASYDYLIVGAGFAGATTARLLADAGKRVLIIDKRDHIGGNAYDYVNEHGIRVQKYGVHAFHTNSDAIWNFLSRFTEWTPYEHRVLSSVKGMLVPFPINRNTLDMLGIEAKPEPIAHPKNAEEQCLATVGRELYELFFEGYTLKHWGRPAREIDASVTARLPFRPESRDDRVFTDRYQAVPRDGYTKMFARMIDHPDIDFRLGEFPGLSVFTVPHVIWTGPIDEYFGHRFGKLPYRSLRWEELTWRNLKRTSQATTQINFPSSAVEHTRTIEWRHVGSQCVDATTISTEYPAAEGEPYYPIPAPENRALYAKYRALADETPNVTFIGRLATYQYLNMDQVVGQAMAAFRRMALTPA